MTDRKFYRGYVFVVVILLAIVGFGALFLDQPTVTGYKMYQYADSSLQTYDSVELGESLEYDEFTGELKTIPFPVTLTKDASVTMRGYANITGLYPFMRHLLGPEYLILVDEDFNPISFPIELTGDPTVYQLRLIQEAGLIHVKGTLYNYTGWDESQYTVLQVDYVDSYTVSRDPKPLTVEQVSLQTDSTNYHADDTAYVTIRNLSEDWLNAGRSLSLYRDVNGSWVKVQSYPDYYLVTDELVFFFPGTSWTHKLPLSHLTTGYYKLEKTVWHHSSTKINVSTYFTVLEPFPDYSNSTHVFALESINCSLPTVPDVVPVARKQTILISDEDAEEIAVNVFGFTEPYSVDDEVNPTIRKNKQRLSFSTKYDILYRSSYPDSFNNWNRTHVIEIAEAFLSKLKQYWIDESPLNQTIISVAPSHISSSSPLTHTIREVGVRYYNTLEGIPLEGPGADFHISVCREEVSSCEIRRPVVTVEGYTNVTVTPTEAIQLLLMGESATPELGFVVDQVLPRGSKLTINDVSLVYHTSQQSDWLVPVYVIQGKVHLDPADYGEDTSDFWWYIYATNFRAPTE